MPERYRGVRLHRLQLFPDCPRQWRRTVLERLGDCGRACERVPTVGRGTERPPGRPRRAHCDLSERNIGAVPTSCGISWERPDPDLTARTHQFLGQQLLIGQHGPIFGGQNLVWEPLKCVVRLGNALCCADNEANRRVLFGLRPVLTGIVEVQVHLAGVGVAELAGFQVDDQQAL